MNLSLGKIPHKRLYIYWLRLIFLVLICCNYASSNAQTYSTQRNQIFFYNLGLNGLIGGVGGMINKDENETRGQAFIKNFAKGSLGGFIKYTAKSNLYYFQNPSITPFLKFNRMYYYLGHSFVKNASLNKPLLSSYNLNLYGADMDFYREEGKFKVKARASVSTLQNLIWFSTISEYNFNFQKTVDYGLFCFDYNPAPGSNVSSGFATYNTIAVYQNAFSTVLPHELVHSYQFSDFVLISNIFNNSFKKVREGKYYKFLERYFYLDIPYNSALYVVQPKPAHFRNFFEFEAEHFSTRLFIQR